MSCELITPMYGGGVKVGEIDAEMPVRATALRGQLRFWWRLLRGAGLDGRNLFDIESSLWGGISATKPRASRVAVQVQCRAVSEKDLVGRAGGEIPAYALVSEQGREPRLLTAGYRFSILIKFSPTASSSQREEVFEAVRWWSAFGGVGARTRRGFGAVKASSTDIDLRPVSADEVLSLGGSLAVRAAAGQDAIKAWSAALAALQGFRQYRQARGAGRGKGWGGRPGRSQWPEADAIRRIAGRQASPRARFHPISKHNESFPRAAFGLPIVFHFKDHADPEDHVLEPSGYERMASPLILRPYFDGKQYRPSALLLPGWQDRISTEVKFKGLDPRQVEPRIAWPCDEARRTKYADEVQPLGKYRRTDALSAFMKHFSNGVGGE